MAVHDLRSLLSVLRRLTQGERNTALPIVGVTETHFSLPISTFFVFCWLMGRPNPPIRLLQRLQ